MMHVVLVGVSLRALVKLLVVEYFPDVLHQELAAVDRSSTVIKRSDSLTAFE